MTKPTKRRPGDGVRWRLHTGDKKQWTAKLGHHVAVITEQAVLPFGGTPIQLYPLHIDGQELQPTSNSLERAKHEGEKRLTAVVKNDRHASDANKVYSRLFGFTV